FQESEVVKRERLALKCGVIAMAVALFLIIGNLAIASSSASGADTALVIDGFTQALALVEANYSGEVDYDRLVDASVSGMLRELDPHSNYYTKEEFLELRSQQQ